MVKPSSKPTALDDDDRRTLLQLARSAITAALDETEPPRLKDPSPALSEQRGAFVTLRMGTRLRGCIGRMEAVAPLWATVCEMAVAAAFQDPRFQRVTHADLASLVVEVSVLSALEEIGGADDIRIGRDGLVIDKGGRRGVLLPQVAVECGWDAEMFLSRTCEKALLPADAWRDDDTVIYAFTATVFGEV